MKHTVKGVKNLLVFLGSGMLTLRIFSSAGNMQPGRQCAASHLLTESESETPTVVTNDPQLSESTFCLACHDAAFDVTGPVYFVLHAIRPMPALIKKRCAGIMATTPGAVWSVIPFR